MKSEKSYLEHSKTDIYLRRALISGSVMLTGIALRKSLEIIYKRASGFEPPKNPHHKNAGWFRAIMWSISTGAVLGAAKTILRPPIQTGIDKLMKKEEGRG